MLIKDVDIFYCIKIFISKSIYAVETLPQVR